MSNLDEFALIRHLTGRRGLRPTGLGNGVVVGIGDDAAVTRITPGYEAVLSCDTMVEDIHFKPITMKYEDIGFKAMASNISDMAAMGAKPKYALVALSTPKDVPPNRLQQLYDGLYECAERFAVDIVGGDTTSTRQWLTVTVTLIGEAEQGRALLRSAAKPGDIVFVTGEGIGRSAAGLHYLLERAQDVYRMNNVAAHLLPLIEAHQRPVPDVSAGRLLLKSGICRACNDISDGLASEAWEIAEASAVGIVLDEASLPQDDCLLQYAKETGKDALDWMLFGGEDYRLLGTAARGGWNDLVAMFRQAGLPLHPIGEAIAGGPSVQLKRKDGRVQPVPKKGYNHFT